VRVQKTQQHQIGDKTMNELDIFLKSYIEAALWSSIDPETEAHLDDLVDEDDLALEAMNEMREDCVSFLSNEIVQEAIDLRGAEYVAHDFWLTRNGHGAGFWDGDYPEPLGTQLTELSQAYGEAYLYLGDDGQVYSA
jgi:hypothetical protein